MSVQGTLAYLSSPAKHMKHHYPDTIVGYLVHTSRQGYSTHPIDSHKDTAPVQLDFRCAECCQFCQSDETPTADNTLGSLIPVYRVNIGIFNQICDSCLKLVVDGVRPTGAALSLFGRTSNN